MALRLSRAFGTTLDLWLNRQKNHDLWLAKRGSDDWRPLALLPETVLHADLQNRRCKTISAPFSAIMTVGPWMLLPVMVGMIEASITRRFSTP